MRLILGTAWHSLEIESVTNPPGQYQASAKKNLRFHFRPKEYDPALLEHVAKLAAKEASLRFPVAHSAKKTGIFSLLSVTFNFYLVIPFPQDRLPVRILRFHGKPLGAMRLILTRYKGAL